MKVKKVLAIMLALSITTSLATACTGSKPASNPQTDPAAATKTTDEAAQTGAEEAPVSGDDVMSPYGKYPETVVISTAKRTSSQPNFAEGDSVEDNAMTRYIKDKVNVELKVDWEVDSSEFANKLALMLTSGSLPDMFTLGSGDYLLYKQLEENEMLADLSAGYEACANDYVKTTVGPNGSYDGRNLDPFISDGKMLAFAGGRYGYEHNMAWIRKDWLEQSNLPEPKTLMDLETILQTWKDNPPSEEYVGLVLHYKDVSGVYNGGSASPIFSSFGSYPGAWIEDSNGEVIWGSVAPETKQGLELLAKWYKSGLIDQQFIARNQGNILAELFNASQTGMTFHPWWFVYSIGDFQTKNPDGIAQPYNAPLSDSGRFDVTFPGASGDYIMVRKEYPHPEAVFKMINCEFDMWREFDEEGAQLIKPNRDANVDWGYMFPTSGFNIEPQDCIPAIGRLAKAVVETGGPNGVDIGNPMNLNMAERAADYAKTKTIDGMNWIDYTGRYVASNMMDGPEVNVIYPQYSFVTESMADLKPNLDTLEQTTFLKIITGEQPIDAFDQFVNDWYAQGGQRMTDEVRAMLSE